MTKLVKASVTADAMARRQTAAATAAAPYASAALILPQATGAAAYTPMAAVPHPHSAWAAEPGDTDMAELGAHGSHPARSAVKETLRRGTTLESSTAAIVETGEGEDDDEEESQL